MEDMFNFADELGPSKIIHIYEPAVSLKSILQALGALSENRTRREGKAF